MWCADNNTPALSRCRRRAPLLAGQTQKLNGIYDCADFSAAAAPSFLLSFLSLSLLCDSAINSDADAMAMPQILRELLNAIKSFECCSVVLVLRRLFPPQYSGNLRPLSATR